MIAKTITYKDFNGIERTEKFYFHLSESELTEMEIRKHGFSEYIQKIVDSQNQQLIVDTFKELIQMSYGVKSDDGRKFEKSKELFDDFAATNAYDRLFMELATNADAASEFCTGIIPSDLIESSKQ